MKNTENYNLNLPEGSDKYDIEDFNENFEKLDELIGGRVPIFKVTGTVSQPQDLLELVGFDGTAMACILAIETGTGVLKLGNQTISLMASMIPWAFVTIAANKNVIMGSLMSSVSAGLQSAISTSVYRTSDNGQTYEREILSHTLTSGTGGAQMNNDYVPTSNVSVATKGYVDNAIPDVSNVSDVIYKVGGTASNPVDLFDLINYETGQARSFILVCESQSSTAEGYLKIGDKIEVVSNHHQPWIFGTIVNEKTVTLTKWAHSWNESAGGGGNFISIVYTPRDIEATRFRADLLNRSLSNSYGPFCKMRDGYTPIVDMDIVTKKYVDETVDNIGGGLVVQFIETDGTKATPTKTFAELKDAIESGITPVALFKTITSGEPDVIRASYMAFSGMCIDEDESIAELTPGTIAFVGTFDQGGTRPFYLIFNGNTNTWDYSISWT